MILIISWIGNNSLWKNNCKTLHNQSKLIHLYQNLQKMLIRSQNCIKCLLIIAVIHSMRLSLNHIVIYHNSDSQMLKREMRYAISKILDILTEDQTILDHFYSNQIHRREVQGKKKKMKHFSTICINYTRSIKQQGKRKKVTKRE